MKRSNQSRRKGATMIESTLVLTLYVIMIFSIFDFGYVLFLHSTIVNRASTAARYGALNPTDTTGMQDYVLYGQATGSGSGIFGLTASNVSATRSGSGTTADRVVVTVSGYPFSFVTPWHAGKHTGQTITVAYPVENN
jgi:Flp pilus assembly protein TadG